jgi:hypothetical protein
LKVNWKESLRKLKILKIIMINNSILIKIYHLD